MQVVKGSFLAVQTGVLVAALFMGLVFGGFYFMIVALYAYLYILMLTLPVWLLVFLPMYAWIPLDSPIWHPLLCSLVGIVFGAGIMGGLMIVAPGIVAVPDIDSLGNPGIALAAVVGGVSCYTATQTVRTYRTESPDR